ncbi:MAG TPA: phosphoribosyltransferase [Nanoarchaeota archaeon]|nr:phosphoribosyltransferase [Nanoarchaeota archaeon]
MPSKFKCEFRSWENIYTLSRIVARKIRESNWEPDAIIGITRGGWVPARNLCDFLGVKDLFGVKIEHWGVTATPDGEAKLKWPLNVDLSGKKVLVVDDIIDTGESMLIAIEHIKTLNPKEIRTAALFYIKGSKFIPDYFAEEIEWKWIIFPWNVTEDLINLISNFLKEREIVEISEVIDGLKDWYDIELTEQQLKEVLEEMRIRKIIKVDGNKITKL